MNVYGVGEKVNVVFLSKEHKKREFFFVFSCTIYVSLKCMVSFLKLFLTSNPGTQKKTRLYCLAVYTLVSKNCLKTVKRAVF